MCFRKKRITVLLGAGVPLNLVSQDGFFPSTKNITNEVLNNPYEVYDMNTGNPISKVFFSEDKNTYQYLPIIEWGDNREEIRSDSSASDFIRSIWAYYLTLLIEGEKHPGFLVMDEPCQHSMKEESLKRLFEVCSSITQKQVILFCSSQPHTAEYEENRNAGKTATTNTIQDIVNSMNKVSLNYQVVDPMSIVEKK